MPMDHGLTHIAADGAARMVDVSGKPEQLRVAAASGRIFLRPDTLALIQADRVAKGNVLAVARIAGIQAAKRTSELIPLCHTLLLQQVDVSFEVVPDGMTDRLRGAYHWPHRRGNGGPHGRDRGRPDDLRHVQGGR